ncbi:hypothetical protein [Cellulosimicrobium sp. Marseille-Q4280]|uniref:hypothetical protein n=1 Tax=Cellulosimicrobium sp. Marseille-Q4280 TaxID=2937992 RepID=UPI00203CDFC7|nr:hypothetical protein [Cellulosimicrobium sp. Marseille-Q4280]
MSEQTQTPAPFDYTAAGATAATTQGLDPVIAALTAAGITAVVENTGGWTMVATVTVPGGVAAIIEDGTDLYAVSQYRGDAWREGEEEYGYRVVTGTEAMVAEVRRVTAEITAAHAAEPS